MAFQMIHMEIAYRLLQTEAFHQLPNPAEFLIGSVAPDSVHMNPGYTVEKKIHSHLFEACGQWGDTQDYDRWLKNITAFWQQYGAVEADLSKRSFFAGIVVHCLTDHCNDTMLWRRFQRAHEEMDIEVFRSLFNPEARAIDQWLYKNSSHTPEICKLLALGHGYSIPSMLCMEDISLTKQHLLYEQYQNQDPSLEQTVASHQFLTREILTEFLEKSVHMIQAYSDHISYP